MEYDGSKMIYINGRPVSVRKIVAIILFVAAFAVLLLAGTWAVRTGRVRINLPNDGRLYMVRVINQATGESVAEWTVNTASVTDTLPAGQYEIQVSSDDNRASSYFLSVPRLLRTVSKNASLANQVNRQKLARNTADCPVLSGGQLFSYSCGWSTALTRHLPLTARNYADRQDYKISGIISAEAYRDGILALRLITGQRGNPIVISFIKNGKIVGEKILDSLGESDPREDFNLSLVVDRKKTDSFAVSKQSSGVLILAFKDFESDPVTASPDFGGADIGRLVGSLDLYDGSLLLVMGEYSDQSESGETSKNANLLPTFVRTFSADNLGETGKFEIDEPFKKAGFCAAASICFLQDESLSVFKNSGSRLERVGRVQQVDEFAQFDETGAAYIQNGRVFKLNVEEFSATMVFESDLFTTTEIAYSDQGLLLNATLATALGRDATHTFLLDLKPADSNVFTDEFLPYAPDKESGIWDMDYRDKIILMTVILDSSFVDEAGRIRYDQPDFDKVTRKIRERLAKDGFTESGFSINFIVSN